MRRSKRFGSRAYVGLLAVVASTATALFIVMSALATSGAAFTTVNENQDGSGHCKNGNPAVNCNIYTAKQYVWLNGGPLAASLGDGTYFFAVVAPSGQGGNNNPNDGTPENLSDSTADPWPVGSLNDDLSAIPTGDSYTNRTFTVSNGTISYSGSHEFENNEIRLMPYDDTPNPGGVYILAICQIDTPATQGYPVDPKTCKYDAFKVADGTVCTQDCGPGTASDLTIAKKATGSDTRTFTWGIEKDVDQTKVTDSSGSATFNYTVTVTHDGGTTSDWKITGTIDVTNPNLDNSSNPLPVDITSVTDQLSDGTKCSVTGGGARTLTSADTSLSYECDLSAPPSDGLTNTATVSWPTQFLSDGSVLVGNDAHVDVGSIPFSDTTLVDDCVNVTDTLGGALGKVCSTDPSPSTFTYSNTVAGTPGTCVGQDNTATFTTNTSGTTGSASRTVQYCQPADLTVGKSATPSFTRTYKWTIAKAVDRTRVDQLSGTVTFHYTVTVNSATPAFTDSGWQVAGTITVTNPNTFEDITADVTDAVNNGGVCTVAGGAGVTIPSGGSKTLNYTCTYASAPSPLAGTNTATATWNKSVANTPNGSASGTAGFTFSDGTTGNPTEINKTITVTDSFAGTLGTVTYGGTTLPKAFTYSRAISVTPNACVSYPNTATIVQTGQTASQTVTVCGPVIGGLTMGFWQNKNGQGSSRVAHRLGVSATRARSCARTSRSRICLRQRPAHRSRPMSPTSPRPPMRAARQ